MYLAVYHSCKYLREAMRIAQDQGRRGGSPHMGHSKVIIFESHVLIVSHSILWAKI